MARRRGNAWSVPALPGILRANARACEELAIVQDRLIRVDPADAARHRRLVAAFEHEADLCRDETLPLYWVTADMSQVALDASLDLPVLSPAMAPSPSGVIATDKGLPPLPPPHRDGWMTTTGEAITAGISPSLLLWETLPAHFRLTIYAHESAMPGRLRLSTGPLQELVAVSVPRAHDGTWPPLTPTTPQEDWGGDAEGLTLDGSTLSVLSWACAAWHLMMIPTVADRRRLDTATGGPVRDGDHPEREVTHVDLRPLRQLTAPAEDAPDEGDTRTAKHRWVVRGHWTHQPYGPGASQRRLQWRESYIKGPEGAPLVRSRPVNIWRR